MVGCSECFLTRTVIAGNAQGEKGGDSMARRRPTRVEYVKTVYYGGGGGGRRSLSKRWSWLAIGLGVLAVIMVARAPLLALLIGAGAYYFWRRQNGRRR